MRVLAALLLSAWSAFLGAAADGPSTAELASMASKAAVAGQANLAIYYYALASKEEPDRLDWRLWLAKAYLKRGNFEQAALEADAVLAKQPKNAEALAVKRDIANPAARAKVLNPVDEITTSVPFPEPALEPLPSGVAVWVFGDVASGAEKMNKHNQSVAKAQRFVTAFVPAGELSMEEGKVSLTLDLTASLDLAERLVDDVRVLPYVKGRSRGSAIVGMAEWDRVGKEIAEKLEGDRRLAGMLLDLQPHETSFYPLFAAIKKHSRKPVAAAVAGWNKLVFKYVDAVVLKGFNRATDLNAYTNAVQSAARAFMIDARAMEGKAIIGIPGAATEAEFESKGFTEGNDSGGIGSGVTMENYFKQAVAAVGKNVQINDPAFVGVALWAISPSGGIRPNLEARWYHPSVMADAIWERLKLPVVER